MDSDLAGQMATLRAIETLEMCNIKSNVICMKGAKDPDEYVNKFGASKFKMLIDNANIKS